MYGNTLKQLQVKFKISVIIAVILTVIMVINNITGGTFGISTVGDLLETLCLIVVSPIVMLLGVFGLTLNFEPTIKGFIAPIPIISMIFNYFKGMYMAVRAFVFILKNRNSEDE